VTPSRSETLHSMARNAIGLALFAVVTVGAIALTRELTRDRIEVQRERAEAAAFLDILPPSVDPLVLDDTIKVHDPRLGLRAPAEARVARRDGEAIALLLPVRVPDGYSGDIHLVVGVDRDARVTGVRVLEHRETPGLGDAIEVRRSDWIEDFRGRALGDPPRARWTVRSEGGAFDGFTGATITPRAITRAVARALDWFEEDGRAALQAAGHTRAEGPGEPGEPGEEEAAP